MPFDPDRIVDFLARNWMRLGAVLLALIVIFLITLPFQVFAGAIALALNWSRDHIPGLVQFLGAAAICGILGFVLLSMKASVGQHVLVIVIALIIGNCRFVSDPDGEFRGPQILGALTGAIIAIIQQQWFAYTERRDRSK